MTKLHQLLVLLCQQTFTGHDGTRNVFGTTTQSAAVDVWCRTEDSPCRGHIGGPRRTEMVFCVLPSTDENGFVLDRVRRVAHVRVNFANTVYKASLRHTACVLLHVYCCMRTAACVLLHVYCCMRTAACVLLHVYSCMCTAACVPLHVYCCMCTPACVLLHVYYCMCTTACVLLHVYCCMCTTACVLLHVYYCMCHFPLAAVC
jgi:hypothetical protein